MRVLLVDDMAVNRKLLRWMLKEDEHETIEASNGEEAVALFESEQPDLVLLDVIMPVMDGYETARIIKQMAGDRYVPVIFLTAISDDDALAKCLASGGDDFLTKPFNELILQAKIKAHSRIQELSDQLNQKNKKLMYYQEQTQREHEIVEHVFENALSECFLDSGNIHYYMSPMSAFNGDVMLTAASPSGGLYVMLGDFTGHGLSAAVGALPVSRVFFAMTKLEASIGDIAAEMNKHLLNLLPDYMFCAATVAEINASGDELVMWCGGLPDAVITTPDGNIERLVTSMHMPLGAQEDDEFEQDVYTFKMAQGAQLFLHSDGIIESTNKQGEMFGEDRFHALFKEESVRTSSNKVESIIKHFGKFVDSDEQDDDISLVSIECKPVEGITVKDNKDDITLINMPSWKIRFDISQEQMRERDLPSEMLQILGSSTGLATHKDYLYTIITELYLNALEHGVLRLPSHLKSEDDGFLAFQAEKKSRLETLADGKIIVVFSVVSNGDRPGVKIWIQDSGVGFDHQSIEAANDDKCFGRGFSLIKSLCDDQLYFKEGGRVVEAIYPL
ncbi:MAG: fused response regulator/phosphatase [Pseudomonadales bacterium]|nr:fused response regulator/phosphatase [Pseudomonadales bacterium]